MKYGIVRGPREIEFSPLTVRRRWNMTDDSAEIPRRGVDQKSKRERSKERRSRAKSAGSQTKKGHGGLDSQGSTCS